MLNVYFYLYSIKYQINIYVKQNELADELKNSLEIVGNNLIIRHIDKRTCFIRNRLTIVLNLMRLKKNKETTSIILI